MRIHWYGHSAFLIEAADGTRAMLDPYTAGGYGGSFAYGPIDEQADVVLVSHDHQDHYDPAGVRGTPETLTRPGIYEAAGLKCVGVTSAHDAHGGAERGPNIIWRVTVDGVRCAHLGDLGSQLDDAQVGGIGPVDVVMVPVGGTFTLDPHGARQVIARLAPRAVVPMHYKTDRVTFPIVDVDEFLIGPEPVVRTGSPNLILSLDSLPAQRTIYVLEHSR